MTIERRNKLNKLWPYSHNDETTWKYIDCKIVGSREKGTIKITNWIKNPDFKYAHLDKLRD